MVVAAVNWAGEASCTTRSPTDSPLEPRLGALPSCKEGVERARMTEGVKTETSIPICRMLRGHLLVTCSASRYDRCTAGCVRSSLGTDGWMTRIVRHRTGVEVRASTPMAVL